MVFKVLDLKKNTGFKKIKSEAGGSQIQGYPQVHSQLEASLGYG